MPDSVPNSDHDKVLSPFVGKTLVGFHQQPNEAVGGRWFDDQPLHLVFDDDSEIVIKAGVMHGSGRIYIESIEYIDIVAE